MRFICSGCRAPYGDGENKPRFGYCSKCWDVWLARSGAGVATNQAEWLESKQRKRRAFYDAVMVEVEVPR